MAVQKLEGCRICGAPLGKGQRTLCARHKNNPNIDGPKEFKVRDVVLRLERLERIADHLLTWCAMGAYTE